MQRRWQGALRRERNWQADPQQACSELLRPPNKTARQSTINSIIINQSLKQTCHPTNQAKRTSTKKLLKQAEKGDGNKERGIVEGATRGGAKERGFAAAMAGGSKVALQTRRVEILYNKNNNSNSSRGIYEDLPLPSKRWPHAHACMRAVCMCIPCSAIWCDVI